jgi:hypothetical protein
MLGFWFFFCMGALFGGLASPMAYITFYREYIHHMQHDKARNLALQGALVAFLFILGLAVVSGYVITHAIIPH